MRVHETIISYLEKAIECIEFVSVAMADKKDNNAYRLLSPDNADGIQIPLFLYRDFFGKVAPPLGKKQQEVVEVAEDLGEAWCDLFDAIGQRIRKNHNALEAARSAFNRANESLIALLQSKVGSPPAKNAESVVQELNTAISNLSTAMRKELGSQQSQKRGSVRKKKLTAKSVDGGLSQDDVARDFGVTRQTVLLWEKNETENGPYNKSNKFGYYSALRLDPNLRGAYDVLSQAVKTFRNAQREAKKAGTRFRFSFERFNEKYAKHNAKTNI